MLFSEHLVLSCSCLFSSCLNQAYLRICLWLLWIETTILLSTSNSCGDFHSFPFFQYFVQLGLWTWQVGTLCGQNCLQGKKNLFHVIFTFTSTFLKKTFWLHFDDLSLKFVFSLCLSHRRAPLLCAVGLCLNSAAGSSMSCWPPMNTLSRTSKYWPRWKRSKLCPFFRTWILFLSLHFSFIQSFQYSSPNQWLHDCCLSFLHVSARVWKLLFVTHILTNCSVLTAEYHKLVITDRFEVK